MPSRLGKNFIKAFNTDIGECALKYKIKYWDDDYMESVGFALFKAYWFDPKTKITADPEDPNMITIHNDKTAMIFNVGKRFILTLEGHANPADITQKIDKPTFITENDKGLKIPK